MNNLQINKTYTFKLNSGEELVAKVRTINGDYIGISEPVSIAATQQGMGMVPSMFTAEPGTEVYLYLPNVSLYAKTDDAVSDKYTEATTGIKLPEKKILLG